MAIKVTFWGVRGSIPTPGRKTVKYGGNTACLELRFGDEERLIIIDAGSGLAGLGNVVLSKDMKKGPLDIKIFLTHTHWDHIMGFPFFTPIYIKGSKLEICGPVSFEEGSLESVVSVQLQYKYFPVNYGQLQATINYRALKEEPLDLGGGLTLTTKYLNHPITVLGYKFEYQGKTFCTVYDHEPFSNIFETSPGDPNYNVDAVVEGAKAAVEENEKVRKFFEGADILVHDTQYTLKEYKKDKKGWGHSYFPWAIGQAHKAGVKHLVLFHHDPARSDKELEGLHRRYVARLAGRTTMKISIAQEGTSIEV